MWNESVLHAGRHPLTEMVVDSYIPNDTHMSESEGRAQVKATPDMLTAEFGEPAASVYLVCSSVV